jgi:hypothetical protein
MLFTMDALWSVYARELRHHFPVHAFYEPVNSSQISPGVIGVLDTSGTWVRIDEIPRNHDGGQVDTAPMTWGVRESHSVRCTTAGGA